ncbi:FAD-dependent oxidoreductase [Candidatus Pacearchaeota archaeon]|nr:FAD-dependent oxidoreductase [Candidatus Pacearchaeota archaeon]
MEDVYDVLILGGGPAGLTAAIYCGRYNLKTLVVAGSFGGTANLAGEVENWPGFVGAGRDLMRTIKMQAERFGATFLNADVEKVGMSGVGGQRSEIRGQMSEVGGRGSGVGEGREQGTGKGFVLHYGDKKVVGKSLIIALGTKHRQLGIPGEKEFLGKGVSYCATCDGNFFRGKRVAVVGGADSAAKAALYLADICEKVSIVYRKHELRCEPVSLSAIREKENIEILYHSNPVEVLGENVVTGLKIRRSEVGGRGSGGKQEEGKEEERVLEVDGVFVEIGAVAATEGLKDLGVKMENGYVVTGKDCKTNVEGVFAAGDVTNSVMRQMITAAGEGAVAAKGVHEFLMRRF